MNQKKVAIITGAAGGIGSALVAQFIQADYVVALVDLPGQIILANYPAINPDSDHYLILEGDLAEESFLAHIIGQVMSKWGRIDALINNAVWRKVESIAQSSLEDWNKTLAIGITAPAFLAKHAAAALMQKGLCCTIINMSSVMSTFTAGYASAYSVCKGAIESLTFELATRYGPAGFRVIAVRPGSVNTSLSQDYADDQGDNISVMIQQEIDDRTPLKRSAKPIEIASTVLWLCSEQASFISGTTITVDGGLEHNFNSYTVKKHLKPSEF